MIDEFVFARGPMPSPVQLLVMHAMYVWVVVALAFAVWCIVKSIQDFRSRRRK